MGYLALVATDDFFAEASAGYDGGVPPEPPVTPMDPFGHRRRAEATALGPVYQDEDEYQQALKEWLAAAPVKTEKNEGMSRVPPDVACPVCDKVCELSGQGYGPGCYVPYAGRRWDCYEIWGRNLSAEERRQLIEHERWVPRLLLTLPDGSGTAVV